MKLIVAICALMLGSAFCHAAPLDISLTTLDGKTFSSKAQRGKFLVINFWATWCKPCLKEMPDFSQFASSRKDVAFLGLAYEETDEEELRTFLKKYPVSYEIAKVDVYAPPPKGIDVPKGLPTTLVFDRSGNLLKKFLGPVTSKELAAVMVGPVQ